jgi:7-cyano-7-deazaguanine synthase
MKRQALRDSTALVLFSGGQDSTTCLAWSLSNFGSVETVGFDYGQRHRVELECRDQLLKQLRRIDPEWKDRLGDDHFTIDLAGLGGISQTAMTRYIAIEVAASGLPNTFVPGRNLALIVLAAALAYRRGIEHLVLGVCETDYSGYPDCRDDTIKAMQVAVNLGLETHFSIHTPLMRLSKASTWQLATDLGGKPLVDLITEATHTCYLGERGKRHLWGYGCGDCPACKLRADGFAQFEEDANETRQPQRGT